MDQMDLFKDGPLEQAVDDFLRELDRLGLDERGRRLALLRLLHVHTLAQLSQFEPREQQRFVLWLVEEVMGDGD